MTYKNAIKTLFTLLLGCIFSSFTYAQQVQIQIEHTVGYQPLHLFDSSYTNPFNETFNITKFKYYIVNCRLIDTNLQTSHSPQRSFHLVNEADSSSKQIHLETSAKANALVFTIGIDSNTTMQGIQSNALDPLNGMFWTWNTGYVFAKLEGKSNSSKAPAHHFSYDVGGYKQSENAIKNIVLPLPTSFNKHTHTIVLEANILAWFQATHSIHIATQAVCHVPGKLAMQLADNYAQMFRIKYIK